MNSGNYNQKPLRLHSPLLDGANNSRSKKIYQFEAESNLSLDKISEKEIYTQNPNSEKQIKITQNSSSTINFLETFFKISGLIIFAIGGMLCIMELTEIIRTIQNKSNDFGNSIFIFVFASIATTIANVICLGFSHLINTTKNLYLALEDQDKKLSLLLSKFEKIS